MVFPVCMYTKDLKGRSKRYIMSLAGVIKTSLTVRLSDTPSDKLSVTLLPQQLSVTETDFPCHLSVLVMTAGCISAYPSPLTAIPAGAVATALAGAVPMRPNLAILWPRAGGAVMGLR